MKNEHDSHDDVTEIAQAENVRIKRNPRAKGLSIKGLVLYPGTGGGSVTSYWQWNQLLWPELLIHKRKGWLVGYNSQEKLSLPTLTFTCF